MILSLLLGHLWVHTTDRRGDSHQDTEQSIASNRRPFLCRSIIILGVRAEGTLTYTKTQRGGRMLVFGGYGYVENRQSTKNVFWRCNKYMKYQCRARVVTSKVCDGEIRILDHLHTHPATLHGNKYNSLMDSSVQEREALLISKISNYD